MLFNSYLTESLGQGGLEHYNLEIESLDLLEFNDDYHKETLKRLLEHKYSDPSPDIIILTFNGALVFVEENNLFPGVPKILVSYTGADFAETPDLAVILFSHDFKGNIEHGLTLLPGTKHIYVVAGDSIVDRRSVNSFADAVKGFSDSVSLHYLTGLGVETLLSRVANLPRDSFVYYLSYSQDEQGNIYIARDVCRRVGERANRPVLTFFDIFALKTGILGGRTTTTRSVVANCTEIIKRVFQG